jgi:hypothetical protein
VYSDLTKQLRGVLEADHAFVHQPVEWQGKR